MEDSPRQVAGFVLGWGAMKLEELVPALQLSISPVILISGVSLLLLSMTNRYARVLDRIRELAAHAHDHAHQQHVHAAPQLAVLLRRARLMRWTISAAVVSVLLSALMVMALFVSALGTAGLVPVVAGLFIGSMGALVAALGLFLRDVNLSLSAVILETEDLAPPPLHREPPE